MAEKVHVYSEEGGILGITDTALKRAQASGARAIGATNLVALVRALDNLRSKSTQIESMVLETHGSPGAVYFGGQQLSSATIYSCLGGRGYENMFVENARIFFERLQCRRQVARKGAAYGYWHDLSPQERRSGRRQHFSWPSLVQRQGLSPLGQHLVLLRRQRRVFDAPEPGQLRIGALLPVTPAADFGHDQPSRLGNDVCNTGESTNGETVLSVDRRSPRPPGMGRLVRHRTGFVRRAAQRARRHRIRVEAAERLFVSGGSSGAAPRAPRVRPRSGRPSTTSDATSGT